MNAYDPDRLRAELNAAPAPDFADDLADRAADTAVARGRRRAAGLGVAGVAALAVVGVLAVPPLLDRGPTSGVPAQTPSASATVSPTPSATPSETPSAAPSASPSPTPSGTPWAQPTPSGSPTPDGTTAPPATGDRLVTASGIGELRVGMTLAEGIAAGIATDQAQVCSQYDFSEAGNARFPAIWAYWGESGLHGFAVNGDPYSPDAAAIGEYATDRGIRIGDTLADVEAAYGADAETVTNTEQDWDAVHPEAGLPGALTDMRAVRSGDNALVFIAEDGAIRYIVVTTVNADGKLAGIPSC